MSFRTSYLYSIEAMLSALSSSVELSGEIAVVGAAPEDLDTPQVRRAVAVIGWRAALEALGKLEAFDPVFRPSINGVVGVKVYRSFFDDNTPDSPKNTIESVPWGLWYRNPDAGPESAAYDILTAFDGFSTGDASFDINAADHEDGMVSAQTSLTPSGFIRVPWYQVKRWRAASAFDQAARADEEVSGIVPAPFWALRYTEPRQPSPKLTWGTPEVETEDDRKARLLLEWQERNARLSVIEGACEWGKPYTLLTPEERAAREEYNQLESLQGINEVERGL